MRKRITITIDDKKLGEIRDFIKNNGLTMSHFLEMSATKTMKDPFFN